MLKYGEPIKFRAGEVLANSKFVVLICCPATEFKSAYRSSAELLPNGSAINQMLACAPTGMFAPRCGLSTLTHKRELCFHDTSFVCANFFSMYASAYLVICPPILGPIKTIPFVLPAVACKGLT